MSVNVVDTSFGREHLASRLTRTVRAEIPRDRQPSRASIMQIQIINTPITKDARATASILSDHYEWTTIVDLTPQEWIRRANPTTNPEDVEKAMGLVADELLARALNVLGS